MEQEVLVDNTNTIPATESSVLFSDNQTNEEILSNNNILTTAESSLIYKHSTPSKTNEVNPISSDLSPLDLSIEKTQSIQEYVRLFSEADITSNGNGDTYTVSAADKNMVSATALVLNSLDESGIQTDKELNESDIRYDHDLVYSPKTIEKNPISPDLLPLDLSMGNNTQLIQEHVHVHLISETDITPNDNCDVEPPAELVNETPADENVISTVQHLLNSLDTNGNQTNEGTTIQANVCSFSETNTTLHVNAKLATAENNINSPSSTYYSLDEVIVDNNMTTATCKRTHFVEDEWTSWTVDQMLNQSQLFCSVNNGLVNVQLQQELFEDK